jgi:hypothetical protein
MRYGPKFVALRSITSLISLAALAALLGLGRSATAQDVVRVEEDWELVLGAPDPNLCGPQVVTAMSPLADLNGTHFTLEVNHRSIPYWTPGGLSMHQWNGEQRVQSYDREDRTVMNTENEVVRWTQYMYVEFGNKLVFEVQNGTSTTWGPFGFSGLFKVKANWNQVHINGYSPAVSIAASGPAYAGNRVQSLILKEVRLTLSNGSVLTDNSERVAHLLVE